MRSLTLLATLLSLGTALLLPASAPLAQQSPKAAKAVGESNSAPEAVWKLLQVEATRLIDTVQLLKPAHALDEIKEWVVARTPIAHWATVSIAQNKYGFTGLRETLYELDKFGHAVDEACGEKFPSLWRPFAPPLPPTIGESLEYLRPEIGDQVRFGLRHSPMRVMKLAYRSLLLYLFAWAQRTEWASKALGIDEGAKRPPQWLPKLLEHAAETIEANTDALTAAYVEEEQERLMAEGDWRWWMRKETTESENARPDQPTLVSGSIEMVSDDQGNVVTSVGQRWSSLVAGCEWRVRSLLTGAIGVGRRARRGLSSERAAPGGSSA